MNVSNHIAVMRNTVRMLSGRNIPVHFEGFQPRVEYDTKTKEPVRVVIPNLPNEAPDDLVRAMHGYIDHECGHILESSADDICDTDKSKLWHFIHNCIEDPRINEVMSVKYPGCGPNIRAGYEYLFEKVEPTTGLSPYAKEHVDGIDFTNEEKVKDYQARYACMWFARRANCRFNSDKYDEIDLDRLFAPLEATMDPMMVKRLGANHTTDDVRETTDYFVEFFYKNLDESPSDKPGEAGDLIPTPGGRLDDLKKLEDELGEAVAGAVEHLAEFARKNFHFSNRFDQLITKHDIVKKAKGASINVAEFENEVKQVTNYISKDLRRLLESRKRSWYTGGYRSGRLDQKSLHTVRFGNERVFSRKAEVQATSAAVSLLIDLSGSMSGEKVYMACQSAYAFAMALEQLKIPYEVWGFDMPFGANKYKQEAFSQFRKTTTTGAAKRAINPECIDRMYSFKTFEDSFDIVSKQALVRTAKGSVGLGNNEDSLHVKLALERLSRRPEEKKTLFVFSDGSPAFSPGDQLPSMEALKYYDSVAMRDYRAVIYGIGIQDGSVKEYYANNKEVGELSELPNALFEFLKTRI